MIGSTKIPRQRLVALLLPTIALLPGADCSGGTSSRPAAELLAETQGAAAPWLEDDSPFHVAPPAGKVADAPDERRTEVGLQGGPAGVEAARPAEPAQPMTAQQPGTEEDDELDLPPLPDYMEVKRLPRATEDNPEVPRQPPPGTGPVARVNGEEIERTAYDERVRRTLDAFFGLTGSMPRSVWGQVVGGTLQQQIRWTIDRQKAAELGVSASPDEIEQAFRKFVDDRGGPANWQRFLRHMHVSEEAIRQEVAAKVLHDELVRHGLGDLTISDEQVEQHFREHKRDYYQPPTRHLRQIFISTHEGYDSRMKLVALEQAEKALALLKEGRDFGEVARLHSEGATASKGGDIGWLHAGQMPPEFDRVAFSMQVGTYSGVVRTEMGFHIIQCLEQRYGHQRPLDQELRGEIRRTLQSRTYDRRLRELYRRWYDEARIEYLDPVIEAEAKKVQQSRKRFHLTD